MKDGPLIYRGRKLYCLMKTNFTSDVTKTDGVADVMAVYGEAQHPLERLDDLVIDGMKVWQRTDQFCFSVDAVMVAHFARVRRGHRYADLGTGTGVIPLLLTALGADNITAFEINPVMAALAKRNVVMNGRGNRITVIEGDYCQLTGSKLRESFDGIIVNPPYFAIGNGDISASSDVALALHETHTTIGDVAKAASYLVKYGGYVWVVFAAERLMDLMAALRNAGLEPKRIRAVHSRINTKARLVLVEARRAGKPGLVMEAPLIIYKNGQDYSEEVSAWYGKKE